MGIGFKRSGVFKRVASGALTPAQGTLSLDLSALTLNGQFGGIAVTGAVSISNSGAGNLAGVQHGTITYDDGDGWLSAAISSNVLVVTADPAQVAGGGTYVAQVPITDANASNSPQSVEVTFVVAAAAQPPVISLSPGSLSFSLDEGTTSSGTITVSNVGGSAFTDLAVGSTTYGSGSGWLTKSLNGLSIGVDVDATGLAEGDYTATFPVTDSNASNTGITASVTLSVLPSNPSLLVLTPSTRNFTAIEGDSDPATLTIAITNGGGATLAGPATGSVTYGSGSGWLTTKDVSTVSAGSSYTLTIGLTLGSLTAGVYTATFPVTDANAANSPQTVSVTFNVSDPVPVGNFPAPQFTLPSWLTHDGSTDVLSGEPFASPDTSSYFVGTLRQPTNTQSDFATKLAAGVATDIVELAAGTTTDISSVQTVPAKASGWLWIRSSGYAAFTAGTRVDPTTHAASLATLRATGTNSILRLGQGYVGVIITGIKFTKSPTAGNNGSALVDLGAATQTQASHIPTHVEMRHCVVTNPFANGGPYSRRGVWIRSRYTKIRDCYIDGHTEPGTDSQAILISSTPGDFEIHNCFLEGASENIMAGGVASSVGSSGAVSNFWIHQNYFFKRTAWLTGGASAAYAVRKALLEFKVGEKWVIEGNTFTNHDGSGQQFDVNLGSKPQSASETWNYVRNGLLRYNTFINSASPMQIISANNDAGVGVTNGTQRIQVIGNVWHAQSYSSNSNWIQLNQTRGLPDITIENNVFKASGTAMVLITPGPGQGVTLKTPNLIVRNNLNFGATSQGPIYLDNSGGQNTQALNTACGTGLWTCRSNVVLTRAWDATLQGSPHLNKTAASLAAFGFASSATGDYSLVTGTTYKNIGTDGADPGPNWSRHTAITAGVVSGTPTGS